MSRPTRLRSPERLAATYGPWAVVTGASSGIGRAIATELAGAGLDLVLVARRRDVLERFAADLTARHGIATRVLVADLGRTDEVEAVHTATDDLDVGLLIAAAGFGTTGPFLAADHGAELEMLDLNTRALMSMSLHYARRFAARGRGGIVLMASVLGYQGAASVATYAATKAYVLALAEGLHVELAPSGVDVLASAPGPVSSGFAARAGMTLGKVPTAEDVAAPTLNALGRATTVAPHAKLITWSLAPLPRWARTKIISRAMTSMTTAPADADADAGAGAPTPPQR